MKFLSLLLLIPLANSLAFNSTTCAKNCSASAPVVRVCASDLKLYNSTCLANCGGVDNYVFMACGSLTDTQCQSTCSLQYNAMVCQLNAKLQDQADKTLTNTTVRCSNYGTLFSSLRVAECLHPNTTNFTQVFDCSVLGLSSANCNAKCSNLLAAQKTCAAQPTSLICAIDSIIYRNSCEMNLLLTKPADGFGTNETSSSQNCQNYVLLHYGIITGVAAKPSHG